MLNYNKGPIFLKKMSHVNKALMLPHQHLKQYSTDFNLIVTLWITDIKQRYI